MGLIVQKHFVSKAKACKGGQPGLWSRSEGRMTATASSGVGYHRPALDLARFLAAFGVVLTHALVSPTDWVGNLSLGLFHILTGALAGASALRAQGYLLGRRAWRIALPWLAWSAFYLPVEWWISSPEDRTALLTKPMNLLVGPSLHLWYLPFVLLTMPLVWPVTRWVNSPRRLMLACAVLIVLALPQVWLHGMGALPFPMPQWAFGLPLFAAGLLLARAEQMALTWLPVAALAVLALAGWALTGAWWAAPMGLLAALLFLAARRLPLAGPLPLDIGRAAFGIYLLHPFFALFVYKALGADVHWLPLTLWCFGLSWAATALLLRVPGLRALV